MDYEVTPDTVVDNRALGVNTESYYDDDNDDEESTLENSRNMQKASTVAPTGKPFSLQERIEKSFKILEERNYRDLVILGSVIGSCFLLFIGLLLYLTYVISDLKIAKSEIV
ncbi:hypothetical protein XELAEV_18022795mg [Xenopus laevis]|uniref:Uncharacterized protein n=1 Tax=Xenopus laevis TaxID=8355 RepID=A0A974D5M6_XENLA|nr:hypothetical protein XELAEV_18022795mg [Xenopus laevis]